MRKHLVLSFIQVQGRFGLLFIALVLGGCLPMGAGSNYFKKGSPEEFEQATEICRGARMAVDYSSIANKMAGVVEGALPTRAMLELNETPTETEASAIRAYEEAYRTCNKAYNAVGEFRSATDDILEARISKVRYGLYKGEIPYSVYNYAVVQAMKQRAAFQNEQAMAYQLGAIAGKNNFQKAMQKIQQQQMQTQLNSLQGQLNNYNTGLRGNVFWNCDVRSTDLGLSTTFYDVSCY